jgi:hypothetical protein
MKTTDFKKHINVFSFQGRVFLKFFTLISVMAVISCKKDAKIPVIDEPFPVNPNGAVHIVNDTFKNNTTSLIEAPFLDIDGDRVADFDVIISNTAESSTFSILIIGSGENQIADSSGTMIKPLVSGRKINSTLTAWSKSGYIVKEENGEIMGAASEDRFLAGIKFVKEGKVHFGWIQIKLPLHRGREHSVVLERYFMEPQESTAARAGVEYL